MADKPDYRSGEYNELAARWYRADLVLGGTHEMREAGPNLLVKFPAEHDDVYAERLTQAISDGDYTDTLDGLVGMVFRKPVQIGDNVPAQLQAFLENIDLRGSHFNVFNQRLFRQGVHYGAAYISVDMQRRPVELDGQPIDRGTADALNLRPYWSIYSADHVQDFPRFVTIRGEQVLQQIVFRECVTVPDGEFGQEEITRYRVWRLPVIDSGNEQYTETGTVQWQLWEEVEVEGGTVVNGKAETSVELVDSGDTLLTRIPVAAFIANPEDDNPLYCEGPTLEDLVELCIKDYNKQSDFEKALHYCQAVPYTSGLKDDGALTNVPWGPGVQFDCEVGGKMDYAEPSGNAFATWEKYLETLKAKIKQKGLEMVMEGGAINTTATEQVLRARKRASRLAMLSDAVKDCIETALMHSARWMKFGDDAGGEITMGMTADELTLTSQDVTAFNAMVAAGNMSKLTFFSLLQRAGFYPDEVTPEVEKQRLDDEAAKAKQDIPQQSQPQATFTQPQRLAA